MKAINNYENIEAKQGGDFPRVTAGPYVAVLVNVEDIEAKEYLKCEFDITEGEFTGYARGTFERAGFWPFTMYRSYKSGCEGMFKAFTNAVEASNKDENYKWNWDESTLEGMDIGVVLQCEHYVKNNGDLGERLVVYKVCDAQDVRDGKCKTPADKWTDEAKTLRDATNLLTNDDVAGTGFVIE